MTIPSFSTFGVVSNTAPDTVLTPAYPTAVLANDLLLLQCAHQDSAQLSATVFTPPSSDAGWEFIALSTMVNMRMFLYGKVAAGTEGGGTTSCALVSTSSNTRVEAAIYSFTGMSTTSTSVSGLLESTATTVTGSSFTVFAPTVITIGADRLAVAICAHDNAGDSVYSNFAGETGGDWTMAQSATGSTNRPNMFVQVASLPTAGSTITGGTSTGSTAAGSFICFGLSLIGASTSVSASTSTRTSVIFGTRSRLHCVLPRG